MSAGSEPYVLFELAGSLYALPSRSVQHIEMVDHVTLVPNANAAIDGVVFSRGQVIPALNLRVRFGFPRAANTLRSRIVFAKVHDRIVGLLVDAAREFRSFAGGDISPIEETLTGINGKYIKSVTKLGERLVLILDLEAILNVDDVQAPPMAAAISEQHATS